MTRGRHTAVVKDRVRPPNAALNDTKGLAATTHAMAVDHCVKGRNGITAHVKTEVRNNNRRRACMVFFARELNMNMVNFNQV